MKMRENVGDTRMCTEVAIAKYLREENTPVFSRKYLASIYTTAT